MEKPFYALSLVWNILKRYLPESVTSNIRGMRCYKDNTGAVFDVPAQDAQKVEDIFEHETTNKKVDFKFHRATELPELKEDNVTGNAYGGNTGGHFEGRGGRNMNNFNHPPRH
jgi:GUCT (NUC152) domain